MTFASIREALPIVGKQVVEVTEDDREAESNGAECGISGCRISAVYVHFDDGSTLTFFVLNGNPELGFRYDGYSEEQDTLMDAEDG